MSPFNNSQGSDALELLGPVQVGIREMSEELVLRAVRSSGGDAGPNSADRLRAVLEELSHLNITGLVEDKKQIAAGGGYCDVFIGYVRQGSSRVKVAIRQLRSYIMLHRDFQKVRQILNMKFDIDVIVLNG